MRYALTRTPFDSIFDDNFFKGFLNPVKGGNSYDWSPSVDIIERDKEYTIKAELPGLEEKDISIELKDDVLTLRGERKSEYNEEKENVYRREIYCGTFCRTFNVTNVDQDKIGAKFKNGILSITLPKVKEREPKKITIN